MDFNLRILSQADIEQIESQALRIVSQIGVRVKNDRLCALMKKKGALVEGSMVRFPPEAVHWSLERAPKDVTLYGRNGHALPLKHGYCHLSTYADAVNVADYGAIHLRPTTRQDVINFVRLGQAMPEISIISPVCYARDLPQPIQLLRSAEIVALDSDKHINAGPLNAEEAHMWYELAELTSTGLLLTEQPTISFVVSTTSPLQLDRDSAEVLSMAAERRIPLIACSCPMAGGTSPLALVGTIALHLAEDLFLLTMAQHLQDRTPVVIGGAAGIIDMRTGALSYGAPERHLLLGAIIELADYYGLPHHSPAGSVDAWYPDVHAGAEKMQCWMARKAKDIVWGIGFGSMYNGQAVSLEQCLIDADLWHETEQFFRGLDTAEIDNIFEVIKRIGPGGNFLADEQTYRLMRSQELYYSDLANREGDRGLAMLERAHRKVEQILAGHQYAPPDDIAHEVKRYVETKDRELMHR